MGDVLTVVPVSAATLLLAWRLRTAGSPVRWLVALGAWWAASLALSTVGFFGTGIRSAVVDTVGFAALAVLMAAPVVIGVRWRRRPGTAAVVEQLGLSLLVGVQVYRVAGLAFLAAVGAGTIAPAAGRLTAAWDVGVGVSAVAVALAILAGRAWAPTATRWWALVGLADFATAVTAASLMFPVAGVGALVDGVPPTALGTHPIAFIALFAVPLSILLHLEVLARVGLRRRSSPAAGRGAPHPHPHEQMPATTAPIADVRR